MPNLSNEIVQFAKGNTDFYVAFQDYYNHYSKVENGEDIGPYDTSVSLEEKSKKIHEHFFKEIETRSNFTREGNEDAWAANPTVQWAAMAVINANVNSVLPSTINRSIGVYTDIRYVGAGDIVKFRIKPRSLLTLSYGGKGERISYRQKQFDGDRIISPKEHTITVYTDMYRVLAGKEDIASFIRTVVLTVETRMTRDATSALALGMATGAYPAALSYTGAFDTTQLLTMAETVQAYNFGARPILAGVGTALAKIHPDPAMGYRGIINSSGRTAADGNSINLLGQFYGFDLLQLPQVATGDYETMGLALDPNTVYIISPAVDKLVKGVVSTQMTNSNQFYDNADITQNFTMRRLWEFAFISAAWGGVYKITA